MPVEVDGRGIRPDADQLYLKLRRYNVFARQYCYPRVPDYARCRGLMDTGNLLVAQRAASRILTLPIYSDFALGRCEPNLRHDSAYSV